MIDLIPKLFGMVADFTKIRLVNGELRFSLMRSLLIVLVGCALSGIYLIYENQQKIATTIEANHTEELEAISTHIARIAALEHHNDQIDDHLHYADSQIEELKDNVRDLQYKRSRGHAGLGESNDLAVLLDCFPLDFVFIK